MSLSLYIYIYTYYVYIYIYISYIHTHRLGAQAYFRAPIHLYVRRRVIFMILNSK